MRALAPLIWPVGAFLALIGLGLALPALAQLLDLEIPVLF